MVAVKIKKIDKKAIIPKFSRKGDAAFDIHSLETYTIKPGERHIFQTGIAMEFPDGYGLLYWDRSGLAAKHGIHILAGVIDATYRGEHRIVLLNTGKESYDVKEGDRIAQAILLKLPDVEIEEVDELSDSNRGEGRFGSSGK